MGEIMHFDGGGNHKLHLTKWVSLFQALACHSNK